jgi:hypothetical protein
MTVALAGFACDIWARHAAWKPNRLTSIRSA